MDLSKYQSDNLSTPKNFRIVDNIVFVPKLNEQGMLVAVPAVTDLDGKEWIKHTKQEPVTADEVLDIRSATNRKGFIKSLGEYEKRL